MMSGRPNRTNQPPPPLAGGGSSRNNEYFVPRDGIDREVITADICRYLGPDALVRPGTYEDQTGQVIQGYYVTAYRNLTSAMIQDLKADSARWESERRAAARNTAGASSRAMPGSEYKDSTTHYNRQTNGPSSASATGGYSSARQDPDAMMVDAPPQNYRPYPGTGSQGYNGVNSYSQGQGYGQSSYATTPSYAPPQATYAPPSATDRYASGFSNAPSATSGMVAQQQDYVQGAAYSTYSNPSIVSTGSRNTYPGGGQSVYSTQDQYYPQSSAHTNYAQHAQLTQPTDAFYGRGGYSTSTNKTTKASSDALGSSTGNQSTAAQGYGSIPAEASVANSSSTNPALQRIPSPTSGSQAQMMNSGAAAALRDSRDFGEPQRQARDPRDRERDRERRNRDERERDPDRDEPMESRHSSHRIHRSRP